MFLICDSRENILRTLPKQGRWAEIGVFRGELSQTILDLCEPTELHLIDPWYFDLDFDYFAPPDSSPRFQDPKGWASSIAAWTAADPGVHINDHFETIARSVADRFASDRRVTIHRTMAHLAAGRFSDGYFDFVYIDGAHDYENVLRDLKSYAPKVQPAGAILGDDYCDHGLYSNAAYGVIGAVTHFRRLVAPTELVMNRDIFTFFGLLPAESELLATVLIAAAEAGTLVELPDSIAGNYHHNVVHDSSGGVRYVSSFA